MYHDSLKVNFVQLTAAGLAGSVSLTTENFAQKLATDRIALITEKVCNALALATERITGCSCEGTHRSGRAVDRSEYAAKTHCTAKHHCVFTRKNFALGCGERYRTFTRTVVGKACFEHPIFCCFFVRWVEFCSLLRRATGKQSTTKDDQCFRFIHSVFDSVAIPILVCVARNLQFFTCTTAPRLHHGAFLVWCASRTPAPHRTTSL